MDRLGSVLLLLWPALPSAYPLGHCCVRQPPGSCHLLCLGGSFWTDTSGSSFLGFLRKKAGYRAHRNLLKIVRSEKLPWVSSYPLLLCPSPLVLFCSTASKPGNRRNGVGREGAPAPPRVSECKPPTSSRKQAQREVHSWVWMTVNGGPLLGVLTFSQGTSHSRRWWNMLPGASVSSVC